MRTGMAPSELKSPSGGTGPRKLSVRPSTMATISETVTASVVRSGLGTAASTPSDALACPGRIVNFRLRAA